MERVGTPPATASAVAPATDAAPAPTAAAPASLLLPEPSGSVAVGDEGAALAILWVKSLMQDRSHARQAATASELRIGAANAREIAQRRAAAHDARRARTLAAVGDGAEGVMAGAAAGCRRPDAGERDAGGALAAGGKAAGAGFEVAAGSAEEAAANHEANATEQEQAAAAAERSYERSRDDLGQAGDALTRVLDLLRELLGAQRSTASAAIVRG